MQPKDYTIYAMGLDLCTAQPQDKVELMEETQHLVTTNFLKSGCQLKKKEDELKNIKERIEVLLKKDKARDVEFACLSQQA